MSDSRRSNGRASTFEAAIASLASSVVQAKVMRAPKLRSIRDSLRLLDGQSSTQRISAPS
jgi:hypothetical protein